MRFNEIINSKVAIEDLAQFTITPTAISSSQPPSEITSPRASVRRMERLLAQTPRLKSIVEEESGLLHPSAPNVLIFAGSTRNDSYNKKLANQAAVIAQNMGARVTVIDLKDYSMPLYDGDLEKLEGMPKTAKKLRDLMIASDAILIASPEYNGSFSAVLKNTLDWASKDENGGFSRAAFQGKKFGIMSASPGKMGGARGLAHLRAVIEYVGGEVIQRQVSIPIAHQAFNDKGVIENSIFLKELEDEIAQVIG